MCNSIEHICHVFGRNLIFAFTVLITFLICPGPRLFAQDSITITKPDLKNDFYLPDSSTGRAYPGFDNVSKLHRTFFGENYRKEWNADTRLPVIRLSQFQGGLTIIKQGGGNQTHSLRMEDKSGQEWVVRSVEKYPEAILPKILKKTFVKDILVDAMSAQHPYSALVVPPIAHAVGVPHADPVIGIIAPDSALGPYSKDFAGTICLVEQREPGGKSISYFDLIASVNTNNDNSFDSTAFLKARILDVFIGDWDRHRDQWRFRPKKQDSGIKYTAIPRDRDQVFYTNQGVFPYIESRPYVQPFFEGFNPKIRNVGTLLFTSTMMNARFLNQFSHDDWMKITNEFVAAVTDSVLEYAIHQLPASSYKLRHDDLLRILKSRRADLPRAMSDYYYFLSRNIFIETSDKSELFQIKDTLNGAMQVVIYKLSKQDKVRRRLFSRTFFPLNTKEIRFFTGGGNDSIIINNRESPIKLRFSGDNGKKRYNVIASYKRVPVYEKANNTRFSGDTARIKKHLSDDSANTAIRPGNLFNAFTPFIDIGYNPDDGIMLGFLGRFTRGIDYTTTVFSINRYSSYQQFSFLHSFATRAWNVKYSAEWKKAVGNADLNIKASVYAPNNTQNFFGTGNQTVFNKSGDYKVYYRTRFSLYKLNPSLKWNYHDGSGFSIGPAFEYYTFDSANNAGRYVETMGAVQTYDSNTLAKSKMHGGIIFDYDLNKQDNRLLPTSGYKLNVRLQAYAGLNSYSKSYAQVFTDLVYYKAIDQNEILVLADRVGGGATFGNEAFYQSMFIGGQGNLLGYRKNRFAGQYMAYNNLEARIRLAQFANYILPGQLGMVALYDIGRVWQKEDYSHQWHNGAGGGIYFAPAQMALLEFVMSWSSEGWYPLVSFGFRF